MSGNTQKWNDGFEPIREQRVLRFDNAAPRGVSPSGFIRFGANVNHAGLREPVARLRAAGARGNSVENPDWEEDS